MARRITDKVRAHLQFLSQNGKITPDIVIADAKHEDSPLHQFFTWDVQEAAEQYWLVEARALLRSVTYTVVNEQVSAKISYYLQDPNKGSERNQGYTSLDALREDPDSARRSLLAECDRAAAGLRRARLIAVALGLESHVDAILAHVSGLHETLAEEGA